MSIEQNAAEGIELSLAVRECRPGTLPVHLLGLQDAVADGGRHVRDAGG